MFGLDDAALVAGGAALLDYVSGQSTNEANKDIASSNNAWSAQQYATRYQTMTKDMEAAGLNPMLAYSQSAGQAPSAQQVQFQNPSNFSGAAQSYRSLKESELASAQVDNVKADIELKKAQADAAEGQARQSNAAASAAALNMVTGSDLTRAQTASTYSQISINKATLPKIASEIVTNGAQAGFYRAAARKAVAEGRISEQEFFGALREAEANKSAYGAARPYVKDAVGAIGGIKGAFRTSPTINKSYTINKR